MSIDSFKDYNLEQNSCGENEKIFQTKEDLVVFEIKNNCSANIIKRKLKELKQLEQELEEMKEQEKELGMCLLEDDKTLKKIEELKQWLKENTIEHKVKNGDSLLIICKEYYKHGTYSKILTDELGYKTLIIPGEILHIPSEKWMKKLKKEISEENAKQVNSEKGKMNSEGDKKINEGVVDNNKENITNPEPVSKPKKAEETQSTENNSHQNSYETIIGPKSKETTETNKFNIDNIDIEDTNQDVLDTKTAKETFENGKIDAIQQGLLVYANYLATYANNLEFVKLTFRDDLQKNFLQASKNIIEQIPNIKTPEDLDKLYQENLKYFENNLIFDNEVFGNERIVNQFKSVINACKNGLETNFKIDNKQYISKQEIIKQVSNIKGEIFKTIRKIDETDDGILIKDSWNYEANFHTQTLNHILTETDLIKPKQLADISKIKNFDYNKILNDFLNRKEANDSQTETEILQNNYYLLKLQNNLSQLNIPEYLKQELLKESNNFLKEHFEKGYEKEIKKLAKQKYEQEKINQDFKTYYQDILEKYKQTSLEQYKLFLGEKLINYYLKNIDKSKLIQQVKEDKLIDLYTKIHGLGEYKVSDETETKLKFRSKEVAIQTLMLIPAIRMGNIPAKLALGGMERTAKVKLADYAISAFTFTQVYNIEDIARKDHVNDKKTFGEKYYESLKDRKTLGKNFILLGGMKYLQEANIVEKVEQLTIDKITQIGQKYEKNYNILGKFLGKVNGTATETVSAISLMEGGTIIFDQKNISKEDIAFAVAMVLSLKASGKGEEKIVKKLTELKLNHKLKALYIPEKAQEKLKPTRIKEKHIDKMKEKLKEEKELIILVEDFAKRYQNKPWEEIKDKRYVKNKIDEFVNKSLGIKGEKLIQEDRNIKNEIKNLTEKILEDKYQKYLEEGGNNNYGGEIVDAKLSRAIETEKEYKLINQMIKSIEKQGEDILSKRAIKGVEKFLNRYVGSEKFYKDYPEAKDLPRFDKTKQVKYILNEYIEIGKLIDNLKNKGLSETEKLNSFIDGLKKIDKGMVKLVKNSLEERKKAPKK